MSHLYSFAFGCLALLCVAWNPAFAQDVQYNRDVRPILADRCFACHGPDTAARQAELRLDAAKFAIADRDGLKAIHPGNPEMSDLLRRVTSSHPDDRMPPADSGDPLTAREIATLRRWIENGAEYQTHWAFLPPKRPTPPDVKNDCWPVNEIDRFVLTRLEQKGLAPSPEALPQTLIRRVTLDLTGLPPSLAEVDSFERAWKRDRQVAYRRLLDRLLASPRFGEQMAVRWLDAARYADTNGYFTDEERQMWLWRDWVIAALNDNMPFDQFTIEQLAGDLLPNATVAQRIATGFNRNHMVNNETGIVEEEFRVEYVVDRVDTTATVWLGLTLGCARCHDHKFDPISQRDFYRFFSFFNNVPERGLSGSGGNSAPVLKVTPSEYQQQIDNAKEAVASASRESDLVKSQLQESQKKWEATAAETVPVPDLSGLVAHFPLDGHDERQTTLSGSVKFETGMLDHAATLDGNSCVTAARSPDFDRVDAFSFGAWIRPAGAGSVISRTDDEKEMRGFDVTLRKGRVIVNLVHRWNRNAIHVATADRISGGQWQHLMVTYDGSGKATGVRVFLDGEPQKTETALDNLSGTIRNEQPLRFGRRQTSSSFKGQIDDVRIYDRQLAAEEVRQLTSSQLVQGVVSRPTSQRTAAQVSRLREYFLRHHAAGQLARASKNLDRLRTVERELLLNIPSTMVMQESKEPRPAFVLLRGEYDKPGERVQSGLLNFLATKKNAVAEEGAKERSRLDLARWLVDPANPLTARVTVNRFWQQLFGTGLVRTVDDFGTQGEWPSHPELLDWLATEFVRSGWDTKHLLRLMATSATYRQSAWVSRELLEVDPQNRMLARGPRYRMDAEMLRDNALAISGLLVEKRGGPSVRPYQPAGLWQEVSYDGDKTYRPSTGPSLYRRSLYTFWKRQSPPPNMLAFDAPTRETCMVQRSRTNTPLQALALMNDPTFVEAARVLAEQTMKSAAGARDRIRFAFQRATARRPLPEESAVLLEILRDETASFAKAPRHAARWISVGASRADRSLDAVELAAWATVASVILSLDETITRP